ncbi:MAG: hypothetical protein KatS3mg109_1484 [Pirellulaceae bacterium]|nr:MAG: hypothetical protein KatS3mg109_1484 [Pirellulaceae bacterium]
MKGPACSPNGRMLVVAGEELLPAAADPPSRKATSIRPGSTGVAPALDNPCADQANPARR